MIMNPETRFIEGINKLFPALKSKLTEEADYFYIQLSLVENRVTEAIRLHDLEKARHGFLLVLRLYREGNEETKSLIDTGFVEGVLSLLEPEDQRLGYSLMPKKFQELYTVFWDNF